MAFVVSRTIFRISDYGAVVRAKTAGCYGWFAGGDSFKVFAIAGPTVEEISLGTVVEYC